MPAAAPLTDAETRELLTLRRDVGQLRRQRPTWRQDTLRIKEISFATDAYYYSLATSRFTFSTHRMGFSDAPRQAAPDVKQVLGTRTAQRVQLLLLAGHVLVEGIHPHPGRKLTMAEGRSESRSTRLGIRPVYCV